MSRMKLIPNKEDGFSLIMFIFVFENHYNMKTQEKKKLHIFQKIVEDKRAIRECIQTNGDLKKLAKKRGIKFATPVQYCSD